MVECRFGRLGFRLPVGRSRTFLVPLGLDRDSRRLLGRCGLGHIMRMMVVLWGRLCCLGI